MEVDDAQAIRDFGCCYYHGMYGLPQNRVKALGLWHQAGELGNAKSITVLVLLIILVMGWKGMKRRQIIIGS